MGPYGHIQNIIKPFPATPQVVTKFFLRPQAAPIAVDMRQQTLHKSTYRVVWFERKELQGQGTLCIA